MINKISILYFQLLMTIVTAESNLVPTEYSVKVFNTEKTVLSLGEADNDDDLEIIQGPSDDSQMKEKLNKLHKFVNFVEMSERPREKFFMLPSVRENRRKFIPLFEMSYPDLPHAIAINEKHLSELERRSKFEKLRKRKRKTKMRKTWMKSELREMIQEDMKMTPESLSNREGYDDSKIYETEYLGDVVQNINDNTAFKYSDKGKPEETVKDVFDKIVDVKTPKDCTNYTGLGIQAVECLWKNFQTGEINNNELICSISIILMIWFCLYLLIAIPLWCSKGWCCCCCRCSFCFPHKTVEDIKKYIAQNPPGTYTDAQGVTKVYVPTSKEIELYETLRRLVADF